MYDTFNNIRNIEDDERREKGWGIYQKQQRSGEDRYQVATLGEFEYYAVFDGHGGTWRMGIDHVADYCVNHLHERLAMNISKTDRYNNTDMINMIKRTFIEFDNEMYQKDKLYGSTCTIILADYNRNIVYQINLGDSRSIIFIKDEIISETRDHDPDDSIERERINIGGGWVYYGRINGTLNVSRSFGDFELKFNKDDIYDPVGGLVSAVPDINIIVMKEGMKCILTTDAPFENISITNKTLVDLFNDCAQIKMIEDIPICMGQTIIRTTTDDMTIIAAEI